MPVISLSRSVCPAPGISGTPFSGLFELLDSTFIASDIRTDYYALTTLQGSC